MEVTVLRGADVGLVQPFRLAKVCHRIRGRDIDVIRVADGKNAIAFSERIRIEGINGAQDLSCYAVGKGSQGCGI